MRENISPLTFAILYSIRLKKEVIWQKYLKRCASSFPSSQLKLIKAQLKKNQGKSEKKLQREREFGKNRELILGIMEPQNLNVKGRSDKLMYFSNERLLDLSEKSESYFLKYLLELKVAVHKNNISWIKKIARKLTSVSEIELVIDMSDDLFEGPKEKEQFAFSLVNLYRATHEKLNGSVLSKLMIAHSKNIFKQPKFNSLVDEVSASWSLSEMRNLMGKRQYGKRYAEVWYQLLIGRTSDSEANKFLRSSFSERKLRELPLGGYLIFTHWIPNSVKLREQIFNRLESGLKRRDLLTEIVAYYLIQNDVFKKGLGKRNASLLKPNFQIYRNFYRQTLKSDRAVLFSLYHLVNLGDINEDILPWLY